MKVCFAIGPSSEKIINTMSVSMDNVEFFTYPTIADMVKESTMRHVFFDRIVLSEKIISDGFGEFNVLNDYILEYSDNTSIVLICKTKDNNPIAESFNSVFNSPLYTPVAPKDISLRVLKDIINSDIGTIASRYYNTEVVESVVEPQNEAVSKPEKKGFLKGLFGQKEKKGNISEQESLSVNTVPDVKKPEETPGVVGFELPAGNFVPVGGNVANGVGITPPSNITREEIKDFINSSPASGEGGVISEENDDLSLGDFGKSHTDTGFLDEEDEKTIITNLKSKEDVINSVEDFEKAYLNNRVESSSRDGVYLITGDRGVGVTSFIAEYSISLIQEGKKVLIVDLDYTRNGILSFINTADFIKSGHMRGISGLNPFYDDGIAVLSNGYGFKVKIEEVLKVVNSFRNSYNVILLDCPLDCLDLVDSRLLNGVNVMIRVAGNRGSITSTLLGLTNRTKVKGTVEDLLYSKSDVVVVNKINEYAEDVAFLRKSTMFCRNNWLDKLS